MYWGHCQLFFFFGNFGVKAKGVEDKTTQIRQQVNSCLILYRLCGTIEHKSDSLETYFGKINSSGYVKNGKTFRAVQTTPEIITIIEVSN